MGKYIKLNMRENFKKIHRQIGYDNNFTIYDTDDQKSVIKDICKKMNIDTKMLKERAIMSKISSAKDELKTPDEFELEAGNDYKLRRIAGVYREYQKTLKLNNALILMT